MANTDQKIEEIMKRVLAKMETGNEMKITNGGDQKMIEKQCALTEFVGATEFGDTIGLVIANVDSSLLETMKLEKKISFNRNCWCPYWCRTSYYGC